MSTFQNSICVPRANIRHRDYGQNAALDAYSDADINDTEEFDAISANQRRAAERAMAQRDKRERAGRRGARAAARTHAPDLLGGYSDEDEDDIGAGGAGAGLLAGMRPRARRAYDERVEADADDAAGVEAELPLEQLHDIKAHSIAEWIAIERVHRSIAKHFRTFLMSYTDEQGFSVHYPLIRNLGESE